MKIVEVNYRSDRMPYVFEVPEGINLKKGDLVKTHNKELDIAVCTSDSEEVSENVLNMIMQGKKVTAKILGRYSFERFEE